MKRISVVCAMLISVSAFAQQPHCYTAEFLEQLKLNDPASYQGIQDAEKNAQQYIAQGSTQKSTGDEVYTIPVVVHIVYRTDAENISDEQVFSQIDVLNEDFRMLNEDASLVPDAFAADAADAKLQFVLASFDPQGNPTTGITRTETDVVNWNLFAPTSASNYAENVKDSDDGGENGWNRNCYLNLWVCNITGGVLGYTNPPGGSAAKDGVVIGYKYFGRGGSAASEFDLGRTATHEIGHWLGLWHTWGDDFGACTGSDGIDDTPNQGEENYYTPTFPLTDACSPDFPGVMFMNYMDYVDDVSMYMFTNDQVTKMRSIMEGTRDELLTCTDGFIADVPVYSSKAWINVNVSPNPSANGAFTVYINTAEARSVKLEIYTLQGDVLYTSDQTPSAAQAVNVDMSAYANGVYMVRVSDGSNSVTKQMVIAK